MVFCPLEQSHLNYTFMKSITFFALLASLGVAHADPLLSSWFTDNSSKYARIYTSDANKLAGVSATTWTNGTQVQSLPAYCGVQSVAYSTDWVYIKTSGLAGHVMGPWLNGAFPNLPKNQNVTYRFPRSPGTVPTTKTQTGLGAIGYFVDGVAMFDSRDGFVWTGAAESNGNGYWNRDAYVNEGATFDEGKAHQENTGNHHYHANPIALRYLLGDHVDFNISTKAYTESTTPVTKHSPILGWVRDGYPVYGPYGYSSAMDATSALTRMRTGYVLRDGTTANVDDVRVTGRTLPAWALRLYGAQTVVGPTNFTTYPFGRYMEDKAFRGDIAGQSMGAAGTYDLDEYNGRFCVTPEFPGGTYAYFVAIDASGAPTFPYNIGRAYYGNPTGAAATLAGTETTYVSAGPNTPLTIGTPSVAAPNVTLTWSAVEGGTYSVDASSSASFTPFTNRATGLVATGVSKSSTYATLGSSGTEYGRVNRTALATYDTAGQTAATVAQSTIASYSLTPNTPPAITGISAQSVAMNTATSALAVTVGDVETAVASLTMVGSSSNTTLVPNANITFGGSSANRTVTVTPAQSQTGSATITVGVSDGQDTTNTTFTLTVTGTNAAPTISAIAAQSTNQNTATSAIAFTVGDVDTGAASLTLSGSSANTALVPNANIVFGSSGASRTVTITPAAGQTGSAAITLTVSDGAATATSAFTLTVVPTAPTITNIIATPASPTSADAVVIKANVAASSGRTITSVQLTHNTGAGGTTTVFNETMASVASAPWTGTNANNAWTVTAPVGAGGPPPPNPFSQTAAANHTAVGSGNQFGLEVVGGPPYAGIGDGSVANSTNINAVGTAAYVEFYLAAVNQTTTTGFNFQISANGGTTWTTRITENNITHATHFLFHYDLTAGERVNTLRMRFQFAGGGMGGTGTFRVDDIKVVTTSASAPVTVNMLDNGLNGDGAAGDGVYGYSAIPAQAVGTTVNYTIAATDSASVTTTSANNSYTVVAAAPVLAVTPATGLTSIGTIGGPFTPASVAYTISNTGNASMNWTAAKTAAWVTLSSASGTLAAGANTTVTASINTTANSLAVGSYSDTITFTNSTNGTGNTTRAVSLAVGSNTAPSAPVLAALPLFSQGASKTITWPAVSGATSYTIQIATNAAFTTSVVSQTVTSPSATFTNLASGVTYYYRVVATNAIGSSAASNVVSSTQDSVAPVVAITSPASALSTATATFTVSGTSSDALSGVSNVTVNGVTATTANGFANWSITIPLGYGTNGITAVAYDAAGNVTTTAPVNVTLTATQTYNPLIVPEVMTGTTFNLNLHNSAKRFGNTAFQNTADTTTVCYNNMLMWGPTLIMNKGDWVQLNVANNLTESTTTHWHGFHIPAIMDGGPHQVIPAGTTWRPQFKVDNNAGTYWYHPHLHEHTQDQLIKGGGGMIIIRDPQEAALGLPRTYGVDDFPLALTSRRWAANQFVSGLAGVTASAYGDYMLVNGTLSPQVTLPKQYVRLRILNAEIERSYNLGFSDGRTFYQIATDGGLVNAPVALTRLVLAVGERAEILVDLTGATVGSSLDLQAFNTGQANDFPGGEAATAGQFGSLLNNTTFNILHINVGAATANAVTTRPATLTTNTFYGLADVTNTRTVTITNGFPGGAPFNFDNLSYSSSVINQNLNLNAVERWNITNTSGFSHSFHIHDIQFHLISRTGGNNTGIKTYEEGWKDVLFIGQNQTVSFIAKFDGFASETNPFMYHCHFSNHEDEGLMGQFVVKNNATEALAISSFTRTGDNSLIQLDFRATPGTTYTLQYLSDLTTGTWTDIGSVTSDGSTATFTELDAARLAQPRGFYRVTIPVITQ